MLDTNTNTAYRVDVYVNRIGHIINDNMIVIQIIYNIVL